ncbi:MAG TPA: outer membrane beta-barrel protein [Arsenicitalea sp.]|nr:outer membrane beta-barrel protein [Arsenicitalea sp.]
MRNLFLAGALVLAAGTASPVLAQGVGYSSLMTSPYLWSGFYAGVNVGLGSDATDSIVYGGATFPVVPHGGLLGGAQVGYNYRLGDFGVIGVEADFSAVDIGTDGTFLGDPFSSRLTSFGTVRGRVGYTFDRYMPYLTAGLAWGNSDVNYGTFSTTASSAGWAAGAGLEFAFTDNWSAKAEYLRVDLSNVTVNDTKNDLVVGKTANIMRFGLNYRF